MRIGGVETNCDFGGQSCLQLPTVATLGLASTTPLPPPCPSEDVGLLTKRCNPLLGNCLHLSPHLKTCLHVPRCSSLFQWKNSPKPPTPWLPCWPGSLRLLSWEPASPLLPSRKPDPSLGHYVCCVCFLWKMSCLYRSRVMSDDCSPRFVNIPGPMTPGLF